MIGKPMTRAIYLYLTLIAATTAQAQAPAPQPAPAATRPANIDEPFQARVVLVSGSVSYSLPGAAWQPAKVGDQLPAGTKIRTQIRSRVGLAFGDDAVVVVERATLASIEQFHRTADTKRVALGLGHGTIRASTAETTLRSDMTIQTPTATLSKRGTHNFGISYEPSTQHFRIWIYGQGLVEALNELSMESQFLTAGQYVTQAMIQWILTNTLDRWVKVVDAYGLDDAEKLFNAINESGIGVVEPGEGANIYAMNGRDAGQLAAALAAQQGLIPLILINQPPTLGVVTRGEGNFGTGLGGSSSLFKSARR